MAPSERIRDLSSNLGKTMRQNFRTPSAVSAMASLGVHGLLLLALPLLPLTAAIQATEPEIQKPVGVLELTPQEQGRVPSFSTPEIELPPIAQAPTAKGSDSLLLPLPSPPSTRSEAQPDTSSFFAPPPLPLFIPSVPAPSRTITSIPLPAPQAPESPRRVTRPSPSALPSVQPSPPAEVQTPQSPGADALQNPGAADNSANNPSNTADASNGQPSPSPNSPGPEAQANSNNTDNSGNTDRSPNQVAQRLLARNKELQELYTYSAAGTGVDDANSAFGSWFYQELGQKDLGELKRGEIASDYPRMACPLKQSRQAVVGVVVNGENKVVGEPRLIQSSGYRLFNQKALEAIAAYQFNNQANTNQAYLVTVKFDYSDKVCPAGAVPEPPPAG